MLSKNGGQERSQSMKINLCKICKVKPRYGNLSSCYGCMRTRNREKRDAKAKARLLRKVRSKKYQKSELKKWKRKAWVVFSLWTRRRYADWRGFVKCYTCPAIKHYKEMDAGHLFHGKQDFNPLNIHPQCDSCNRMHSGRREEYAAKVIQEVGQEGFLELRRLANTEGPMTVDDLKGVFIHYSELIRSL